VLREIIYGLHYNETEHRGFVCAGALKNFVESMPANYAINMAGHSMGNIVVGEAIRMGLQVRNYALLQGAISASCFDPRTSLFQSALVNAESKKNGLTPDTYMQWGYRGYLQKVPGHLVSFYNEGDFALRTGRTAKAKETNWFANQRNSKPSNSGPGSYTYSGSPLRARYIMGRGKKASERVLTDARESMALVARSRTFPVGAESRTGGVIGGGVDLLDSQYSFGRERSDHSGEFNRNIQDHMKAFYAALLEAFELAPNQ